jgi:hypothetical protein
MEKREVFDYLKEEYQFKFESYGVKIGVKSNNERFLKKIENHLKNIVPSAYVIDDTLEAEHDFLINVKQDGISEFYELYKDGERVTGGDSEENFFNFSSSKLRLTIAEYAESRVFIHAGVVGWKGKAIVIPGKSFQGKTTLVAELIKQGALYYSDEYAVLDREGLVYPFPKTLSMRGIVDKYKQVEFSHESFGGKVGTKPLSVGMVLLTEYEAGAEWKPEIISAGNGIMELLAHTIPIRYKPQFSLQVLNKMVNRAIIAKSKRGEAKEFVEMLLKFYETKVR